MNVDKEYKVFNIYIAAFLSYKGVKYQRIEVDESNRINIHYDPDSEELYTFLQEFYTEGTIVDLPKYLKLVREIKMELRRATKGNYFRSNKKEG